MGVGAVRTGGGGSGVAGAGSGGSLAGNQIGWAVNAVWTYRAALFSPLTAGPCVARSLCFSVV